MTVNTSTEVRIVYDEDDVRHLECDWGRISNPTGDPTLGVESLLLIDLRSFERIINNGGSERQEYSDGPGLVHAEVVDGLRFIHLDYCDQRFTWELFDANWEDIEADTFFVGRWPD